VIAKCKKRGNALDRGLLPDVETYHKFNEETKAKEERGMKKGWLLCSWMKKYVL
jgi:hypothetical protein